MRRHGKLSSYYGGRLGTERLVQLHLILRKHQIAGFCRSDAGDAGEENGVISFQQSSAMYNQTA
jgi:hypothetical protein